jgi:hypothetical protein
VAGPEWEPVRAATATLASHPALAPRAP